MGAVARDENRKSLMEGRDVMRRSNALWILAFVVFFGSSSIVLLSATVDSKKSEVQQFQDRVNLFWDCRLKGDYVTIYDLMSPDIRETVTRPEFVGAKGFVNYYSYDIEGIEIKGDEARTRVTYTWKANHPLFEKSKVKEHTMEDLWVKEGGVWYKKFTTPTATPSQPQKASDDME